MKHYPLFYETWKTNENDRNIEFNLDGGSIATSQVVSLKIKIKPKKGVTTENLTILKRHFEP